jgi:ketosteroid isomerase-like protein
MDAEANTRTLKELFAAFQSGDIDGVLERLTEDVEWVTLGSPAVPYAGAYRGREDVARFLSILDSELDYEFWEPREFIAQGDTVAVVGAER